MIRVEGLGSSRKFGFKFPVSGSVLVLFSSMANTMANTTELYN